MAEQLAASEVISSPQAEYDSLRNVSEESPCPYLPGMQSRCEAYTVDDIDGDAYEEMLARGFRRSGRVVYRPRCRHCNECRQLRIPVERFEPTRSMRRVTRRNVDVRVEIGDPIPTHEKFNLFRRYLAGQHDGTMPRTFEAFVEFLYNSPVPGLEVRYSIGSRLVGVSINDRCPGGLSSVYMCFDPEFRRRSLGTFSVLWEIAYCRREGLPYYYLGYYVANSRTMAYKSRFRPNEILAGEDHWVTFQG